MLQSLALLVLTMPFATEARAQDIQDLDSTGGAARQRAPKQEVIREIVRGWYVKGAAGGGGYLLDMRQILRPGASIAIALGNDFIDTEANSMGWEVALHTGAYDGLDMNQQRLLLNGDVRVQGDIRTVAMMANFEYSVYPVRRLGIGGRAGAGFLTAPLLVHRDTLGGAVPTVHTQPYPLVFVGPTLEYYTKLSHFSLGVDVDVSYLFGFDVGVHGQGFMKYAF